MKIRGFAGVILAAACMQGVFAQAELDTLWLCRDSIPDLSAEQLWLGMFLADTFPDNRGAFTTVDTGVSQDGSPYINFDYQFNNDSVHLKGITKTGTDTVFNCAPRPGYAGFKIYWDFGNVKFYASRHDSMVLWHKGPLLNHKVKMVWGQGGACGGAVNYQYFGEFKSSPVWKRESFAFPEKRGATSAYPDSPFVKDGLFELRMLIYDDSSVTTSPVSEKGSLKLDNMCFIKSSTGIIRNSRHLPDVAGGHNFFVPAVSGTVTLAVFSLQGEQLFKKTVNVTAGRRYPVRQFALKNSRLPAQLIKFVRVSGPGLNITAKVF
jgi:hypothetical protein